MSGSLADSATWPRHRLHLDVPGIVEVVVAHGTEESRDLAALIHGEIGDRPLVRVHSRCLYGEVFGSHDCDCQIQLLAALVMISRAGSGILVYLDQEGRGAGLFGKARGYELAQRESIDSFSAYEALEYDPDSRRYSDAAELLKGLGVRSITLLTNNPSKVQGMVDSGLDVVQRILDPSEVGLSTPLEAREYIETKRQRGHLIP